MTLALWIIGGVGAACAFVVLCCVRLGARSDIKLSEDELDFDCECALSTELSDHSFVVAGAAK